MALLERGELLQRERVDPPQLGVLALGAREPGLLAPPVEGLRGSRLRGRLPRLVGRRVRRIRLRTFTKCRIGCLRRRALARGFGIRRRDLLHFVAHGGGRGGLVQRDGHVGAVLRDEDVLVEPELLGCALQQGGEVQLLLVGLHLEPVHVLIEGGEPLAQARLGAAQLRELLVVLGALGLRRRQLHARLGQRPVGGVEHRGERLDDAGRRGHLVLTDHGATRGLLGRRPLRLQLTLQSVGLSMLGAHALACRLEADARLHLRLTRRLQLGEELVARGDVEDGPRGRRVAVTLTRGAVERGLGGRDRLLELADGGGETLPLA